MAPSTEDQQQPQTEEQRPSMFMTGIKLAVAAGFLLSAVRTFQNNANNANGSTMGITGVSAAEVNDEFPRRRLAELDNSDVPSYMTPVIKDLREREQLMEETPPEEVKYWFEYTGPLQVRS